MVCELGHRNVDLKLDMGFKGYIHKEWVERRQWEIRKEAKTNMGYWSKSQWSPLLSYSLQFSNSDFVMPLWLEICHVFSPCSQSQDTHNRRQCVQQTTTVFLEKNMHTHSGTAWSHYKPHLQQHIKDGMHPKCWVLSDTWLHTIRFNVTTQRDNGTTDDSACQRFCQHKIKLKLSSYRSIHQRTLKPLPTQQKKH